MLGFARNSLRRQLLCKGTNERIKVKVKLLEANLYNNAAYPISSTTGSIQQLTAGRRRRFTDTTTTTTTTGNTNNNNKISDTKSSSVETANTTTTNNNNEINELEEFMKFFLNANTMPLGTINDTQWEDAIIAMEYLLLDVSTNNGGGIAIHSAEQLLKRLTYEHYATMNPYNLTKNHNRTEILIKSYTSLLQVWLHLHSKYNKSDMALTHAENAFTDLLKLNSMLVSSQSSPSSSSSSSPSTLSSEQLLFPTNEFIMLVNGWLQLETFMGTQHATNLLLNSTENNKYEVLSTDASSLIIPCFHSTATQLIHLQQYYNEEEKELNQALAIQLFDRMVFLKKQTGWHEMELPEGGQRETFLNFFTIQDETKKVVIDKEGDEMDTTTTTTIAGSTSSVSSFEADIMKKRVMELIQISEDQKPADMKTIESILDKLSPETSDAELCINIIDFYIRVGDLQKATMWLQRLESSSTSSSSTTDVSSSLVVAVPDDVLMEQFQFVFQAWNDSNDKQAPWRMDELMKRMEAIVTKSSSSLSSSSSSNNNNTISTSIDSKIYNILFQKWMKSGDSVASRKVQDTYTRMIQLDTNNNNNTIKPDIYTYMIVLKAMLLQKDSTNNNNNNNVRQQVDEIMNNMLKELDDTFNNNNEDTTNDIVNAIIDIVGLSSSSDETTISITLLHKLLHQMKENGFDITNKVCQKILESTLENNNKSNNNNKSTNNNNNNNTMTNETISIVQYLEQNVKDFDLSCYHMSLKIYFKYDTKNRPSQDMKSLFLRTLLRFKSTEEKDFSLSKATTTTTTTNNNNNNEKLIHDILIDLFTVFASRNWHNQAIDYLIEAENILLTESSSSSSSDIKNNNNNNNNLESSKKSHHYHKNYYSPIPLTCYERVMKRKWYTSKNSHTVISTFNRLMGFYKNDGYINLKPNQDIFEYYMKATAQVKKNHPEEVEKIIYEMIDLYDDDDDESISTTTNNNNTNNKPTTEMFNTILTAWRQAKLKDEGSKKSLELFELMKKLHIKPNTMTMNLIMQNVLKGGGGGNNNNDNDNDNDNGRIYTTILELIQQFTTEYNLEHNIYSYHCLLDACATAKKEDHQEALNHCSNILEQMRQGGKGIGGVGVNNITYGILIKVIRRLIPPGKRRDTVASSMFLLCCEDGMLCTRNKENFESIMNKMTWKQLYTTKLSSDGGDGKERLLEWSRNVKPKNNNDTISNSSSSSSSNNNRDGMTKDAA